MMRHIVNQVHAHMPYHLLPRHLERILQEKLNLEIYFHHWALESLDKQQCLDMAKRLQDAGLKITFHAPFIDLRPGALDEIIRQACVDRLKEAFDLAPFFRPAKIVCHAGFDERYYVFGEDLWLESSVKTWQELLALAEDYGTVIALENTYEQSPDMLRRLFEALASDRVCFCLDVGHFNVFSYELLNRWLDVLGRYLRHLHLHDNFGRQDEHLPVGKGTFPFAELFAALKRKRIRPTITLEAHNPENLWHSIRNIDRLGLLEV
ncbi:MAG TPA: sugar phosphate isomerase/epimerase family protein [Smithella sp.]|nr:sugar phosphate isomerase/epimerase family protein [Smithella sp.]